LKNVYLWRGLKEWYEGCFTGKRDLIIDKRK
jgi:hypothetical protein